MYEASHGRYPGAAGTNWTVMASLSFNVSDGGATRARVRRGLAEAAAREAMQGQLQEEIGLQVRRAWTDRTAASQRLVHAEAATALAGESLKIVEDRYQEGLAPLVELLDAETARTRARTRAVQALRDLVVATSALDVAVGRP
jgi:outer membrane protein TolC